MVIARRRALTPLFQPLSAALFENGTEPPLKWNTAGEAPAAGEQPGWLNKLRGHLGQ